MDINAAVGGKAGLSQRLALEYADRVSATPVDVPDEFFAKLQRLFSEREIVELTTHIAHENYNAKSNRPLHAAGAFSSPSTRSRAASRGRWRPSHPCRVGRRRSGRRSGRG